MLIQYILDAKMHNFGYKLIKIYSFCTCFPSKALFIDLQPYNQKQIIQKTGERCHLYVEHLFFQALSINFWKSRQ